MILTGLFPAMLMTLAQPPATASALDTHLAAWAKTAASITRFQTEFTLKRTEAVFKKSREYTGSVTLMKPNLFSMKFISKQNPADWEEYLCDGKSIYEYNGVAKTITEYKLGARVLTPLDDSPVMAMLGGITAAEIKKRFVVSLAKEDDNYVYLAIKPTLSKDKQEFEEAVLALFAPKARAPAAPYLPAMIQVKKPNGDMETWMLARQVINPEVEQATFRPRDEPGFTRRSYSPGQPSLQPGTLGRAGVPPQKE